MEHRIFNTSFASVYPYYIAKAEKKGKSKEQVDELIYWLTGYNDKQLNEAINDERTFREFFDKAPRMNPNVSLINGLICGIRVEEIEDPLMQKLRYLDKIIDELARGKKFENIKRK